MMKVDYIVLVLLAGVQLAALIIVWLIGAVIGYLIKKYYHP